VSGEKAAGVYARASSIENRSLFGAVKEQRGGRRMRGTKSEETITFSERVGGDSERGARRINDRCGSVCVM
jgi:hypothetical protein